MSNNSKLALVTGAAGTMGRSVVEAMVAAGIRVAAVDINRGALDALAAHVGGETRAFDFDISDPAAVERGVARISSEMGDVDILVNNAGILSNNKALATTPDEWNRIMAINLSGAFYLIQQVLPAMRRRKWGRIINTTSLAAKTGGITAGTAYSVSKAAMIGLTFSIAAETTGDGITVNGIAPAYVRTPMITEQLTDEQRETVRKKIPVGRFCEPEEFAHVVMFLAAENSGFITGEIIDLNGGLQFD